MCIRFSGRPPVWAQRVCPPVVTERVNLPFEGDLFPVSAHCEQLLTTLYGDWRRIPPPEERQCKVHGEIVDLDSSYENYLQQQRETKYEVLSRSIR